MSNMVEVLVQRKYASGALVASAASEATTTATHPTWSLEHS